MTTHKTPISRQGFEAMQAELEDLLEVERPKVVREVEAAAAQGDRSENAEYIYGKKRLREIDRRWKFLSQRMDRVVVVDKPPEDLDIVRFGAQVELEGVAGRTMKLQLVGEDEINPAAGRISMKSPLGTAILTRRLGETVQVPTPKGVVAWTIRSIAY